MESAKERALRILKDLEGTLDMTPKSQAETLGMPARLTAEADALQREHRDALDTLVEGARFDTRRMPDVTGSVYGWFMCKIIGDPNLVAGILGEAILRLATLPDPPSDGFPELVEDIDSET